MEAASGGDVQTDISESLLTTVNESSGLTALVEDGSFSFYDT